MQRNTNRTLEDSPERIRKGTAQLTDRLDRERVHELRDPGIYCEDGEKWLLYSTAGEQGIAIMQLTD